MIEFREVETHFKNDRKWCANYHDETVAHIKLTKGDGVHTVDCITVEWYDNSLLDNIKDYYDMRIEVTIFAAEKHQLFDDITYSHSIGRCTYFS